MIEVKISKTAGVKTIIVEDSVTPAVIRENEGISQSTTLFLDGAPLSESQANQSLAELGVVQSCRLSAITKIDNA